MVEEAVAVVIKDSWGVIHQQLLVSRRYFFSYKKHSYSLQNLQMHF